MERTWNLPGAYASWTMTLTTTPADGAVEPFNDNWALDPLDRVGKHFLDMANLLECQRLLDEQSRHGSICM